MPGSIDTELKLVIPGNHDLELDKPYWEAQCEFEGTPEDLDDHDLAIKAMTGPLASGAKFTIYVSPYAPAFSDWAFTYEHNQDRFNKPHQVADGVTSIATKAISDDVSIVMTHGPPKGILDWCPQGSVGCKNVLEAIRRIKPIMHCFGHIHESNGVEIVDWKKPAPDRLSPGKNEAIHRYFDDPYPNLYPQPFMWKDGHGDRTLVVNDAIVTGDNKSEQAPWLISLDLPCLL